MGKGGANPYPGWWATSKEPHAPRGQTRKNKLPDDIYKSEQDKEREYYDQYYKEKGYSQRRKEFEEEFKKKFMRGDFFEFSSTKSDNSFTHENDIHPIFKIKKSSSQEEFKKEYKKLILKHHPDKGGNSSMFIKIKEAYDNLFI
jgi:DnaJ-domain-containing protein 1